MLFNLKTDIVCDVLMKNELLLYMFVHIWTFWYDLTNVYYFVVLGNLFPSPGECNMYRWWSIPRNSYKFCIALITGNMVYERVIAIREEFLMILWGIIPFAPILNAIIMCMWKTVKANHLRQMIDIKELFATVIYTGCHRT